MRLAKETLLWLNVATWSRKYSAIRIKIVCCVVSEDYSSKSQLMLHATPLHMPKHLEGRTMKTRRSIKTVQCKVMFNKTFTEKKRGQKGNCLPTFISGSLVEEVSV